MQQYEKIARAQSATRFRATALDFDSENKNPNVNITKGQVIVVDDYSRNFNGFEPK